VSASTLRASACLADKASRRYATRPESYSPLDLAGKTWNCLQYPAGLKAVCEFVEFGVEAHDHGEVWCSGMT
jgi:hypothetical protein